MRLRILLFVVPIFLISCGTEKKAIKAFNLGKYQNSIDLYKKSVAKNPNNGKANYFIAESYRLSNRPKKQRHITLRLEAVESTKILFSFIMLNP